MCKWTVLVFVIGLLIEVSAGNSTIVINEISGADSAQLGSNSTTIVCDYDYGNDTGVEIKWFYNETVPIFLWVPDFNEPQAMGPFSNLLEVTNNTIHFKEINKDLTGSYTCKVSSNEGEQFRTEPLVAYQPAVEVVFFPEDNTATLVCAAYEVYPIPTITVTGSYISQSNDSIFLDPAGADDMRLTNNDFWNISKAYTYDKQNFTGSAEFVCNVFIPDTDFNETRIVSYRAPGDEPTTEYPDFTTETSVNSTMINSTTINSTNSTTQADFGVVSSAPTLWLMMASTLLVLGSKL